MLADGFLGVHVWTDMAKAKAVWWVLREQTTPDLGGDRTRARCEVWRPDTRLLVAGRLFARDLPSRE